MSGIAADWYRVADLRLRLRAHAKIHRHRTREQLWYVLQDRQTGRFFRISPGANLILCLMDGRRSMEEIWRLVGNRLGRDRPTRADTLSLLVQVHQADLLLTGLPPDMAELERRAGHARRNPLVTLLRNPMAMRLPLLDPDRFLDRSMALARLAFNRASLALWCLLVGSAAVLAAGVMVELAVAALAMIAWTNLGPGVLRATAYTIMLLSGVTTLLFNANPLLRFDGYYVLSDLLDIPNLDTRSKRYLVYLIQRYLLGSERASSPVQAAGEAFWFAAYGITATVYRLFIMLGLALLISSKYFVVGAVLAIVTLSQMVGLPVFRGVRYLATGPALRRGRRRAILGTASAAVLIMLLLFAVPLPHATIGTGVVWVPENAALRAGADGVVARLAAAPDQAVTAGDRLIELEDPVAAAEVDVDRAELAVLEGRYLAVNLIDRPQALLVQEALDRARARLATAQQHRDDLVVVASRPGRFVVPDASKLVGRYVRKGVVLGYVIGADDPDIHVVVPQSDIDLVRRQTTTVSVRFTEDVAAERVAAVVRETPSALERVPAPGLSQDGGGPMLLDPASNQRDRPLEPFYQLELRPLDPMPFARIGSHVYVRFAYPAEPLAWRLVRDLRQILLHRLDQ